MPTHKKKLLWEKSGPIATSNLIFLGLGWPWVGKFVGLIIILYMFSNPTEFGKYCKHPTKWKQGAAWDQGSGQRR